MTIDHGRVPTAPGSHPSGHAGCAVDGAPRFDPSRDETSGIPTRTVSLADLTPSELAAIFAHMNSDDQAHFFNKVASETRGWPGTGWCGQCAYIIDGLSDEGAKVVLTLAGHIEARDSDGPRMAETNEDSARGVAGPARAEGIAHD
jgi:hypothetical protein